MIMLGRYNTYVLKIQLTLFSMNNCIEFISNNIKNILLFALKYAIKSVLILQIIKLPQNSLVPQHSCTQSRATRALPNRDTCCKVNVFAYKVTQLRTIFVLVVPHFL